MSFSSALYYPSIDINDERWLKSAVLFWDEINTIVPDTMENPYNNDSTVLLNYEGILNPINVSSFSKYVELASKDALKYLNSSEGIHMLTDTRNRTDNPMMDRVLIHAQKMNPDLRYVLRSDFKIKKSESGFYEIRKSFADYYMTLLANRVSEDKALALVSNNYINNQLVNSVRCDDYTDINPYNKFKYSRYMDEESCMRPINSSTVNQGLLTNYVIDNLNISDLTPLKDIVDFRRCHKDELAYFRTTLSKLVEPITDVPSYEALQQRIKTIYNDEFLPAYNALKGSLRSSKIQWFFDNISKLCIFSVSTTALPMVLGLEAPQALLLGGGISVVSSVVAYNIQKQKSLRENPYTYLLNINKEFGN